MALQISRALLLLHISITAALLSHTGDTHINLNEKECMKECRDGSVNFGVSKSSFTCCGTHFCDAADAPDLNGRMCYYCDAQDCSNTVRCSGTEDRCVTATVTTGGSPVLVKGCASKNICGALKCSFIRDVSCCEGDLCNAEENVTQSFRSSAEERLEYNDANNVTERLTYHHAKRVRTKFSTRRFSYRNLFSHAESVEKSFLFLCCSLLFYFLWL